MEPNKIRGLLLIRGSSVSEIAQKLTVTRQAVSYTIHNPTKSSRIRQAIAEAIGRPIQEIWPDNSSGKKEAA